MFLFYSYYRTGRWERAPYFHVLTSMSMLTWILIVQVLFWLNRGEVMFGGDQPRFVVKLLIIFTVLCITYWRIAPEKKLATMEIEPLQQKKGNRMLIVFIVASLLLLVAAIFSHPPTASIQQYK